MTELDGTAKPSGKDKKYRCKGVPNKYLNDDFYKTLYNEGTVTVNDIDTFRRELYSSNHTSMWIGKTSKTLTLK